MVGSLEQGKRRSSERTGVEKSIFSTLATYDVWLHSLNKKRSFPNAHSVHVVETVGKKSNLDGLNTSCETFKLPNKVNPTVRDTLIREFRAATLCLCGLSVLPAFWGQVGTKTPG